MKDSVELNKGTNKRIRELYKISFGRKDNKRLFYPRLDEQIIVTEKNALKK